MFKLQITNLTAVRQVKFQFQKIKISNAFDIDFLFFVFFDLLFFKFWNLFVFCFLLFVI